MSPYATPITTDGVTLLAAAQQISMNGASYACATLQGRAGKEVWCWGDNNRGGLGTGDSTARRYPSKMVGVADPKLIMPFGEYGTTCAIDGSNVRCWGNNNGQVGSGATSTSVLAPTVVTLMGGVNPLPNIIDLAGGYVLNGSRDRICALSSARTVQCWGYGFEAYPATYSIPNVVALGGVDSHVRVLTSDNVYHIDTTTRAPNCGLLQ